MAIKDIFQKITKKFTSENLGKTTADITRFSALTEDATEAVSGKRSDSLTKVLKAGTAAALAAGALTRFVAPALSGPVVATVFLGASLYRYYKENFQKSALTAIKKDGLTPCEKPIANGQEVEKQIQKISNQSLVKGK